MDVLGLPEFPAEVPPEREGNSRKAHLQMCEDNPIGWTAQANLEAILEDHGYTTVGVHRAVLARRAATISLRSCLPPPDEPQVPQEKEDDYVHDLTSDGDVESNPGPSSALSCESWNCQGKSKLYEALRLGAFDAYDVVCLQESNFSAEDRCDFSKLVMQRGFHCYHGGGHEGHDTRGRRFTMVKHGWASRLLRTAWCEGQYEWLGVQMDGFVLYNIHRKPGGDEALYTLEVQQLMDDYNRAVIVGDHNVHLGDYTVEAAS